MLGPSDTYIREQLRATKSRVKFCEQHERPNVGGVRNCMEALERGDMRAAVDAYNSVPLGGNGCFNDWFPPVVYDHEDGDYVWAVSDALTERWSRLMQLSVK
ncbi:hypothetical protein ACFL2H_01765 [Planctomycetota bacterium]